MSVMYHTNPNSVPMIIRSTVTTDSSQLTLNEFSGAGAAPASLDDTEQNTVSSVAGAPDNESDEDIFNLAPKYTETRRRATPGRRASALPAKDKKEKKKNDEEEDADIFNLIPRAKFQLPASNPVKKQQQKQKQDLKFSRREWRSSNPNSGVSREEIEQANATLSLLSDEVCTDTAVAPSTRRHRSVSHPKRAVAASTSTAGVMHWSIEISESTSSKTPNVSPGDALWKFTNKTPPRPRSASLPSVTSASETSMILVDKLTESTSATVTSGASSAASAVDLAHDSQAKAPPEKDDNSKKSTRSKLKCVELSRINSHTDSAEQAALRYITESLPMVKLAPSTSSAPKAAVQLTAASAGSKAAVVAASQPELVGCSEGEHSTDTSGRSPSQESQLYATLLLVKAAPRLGEQATKDDRKLAKPPQHSKGGMRPNSSTVGQRKPLDQRIHQDGMQTGPLSHLRNKETRRRSKSSVENLKETKLTGVDITTTAKATPSNSGKATQEPNTKTSTSDAKRKLKASQRKTSRSSRDPSKDSAPNSSTRASPIKRTANSYTGRSRSGTNRAHSASSTNWADPPDFLELKASMQLQSQLSKPRQIQQEALNRILNQASSEEPSYFRDLCSGSEEVALALRQHRGHSASAMKSITATDQRADKDSATRTSVSYKEHQRQTSLPRDRNILPKPRQPARHLSVSSRNNIFGPVKSFPAPPSLPQLPQPTLDFIDPHPHQMDNSESVSTATMSASQSQPTELRQKLLNRGHPWRNLIELTSEMEDSTK